MARSTLLFDRQGPSPESPVPSEYGLKDERSSSIHATTHHLAKAFLTAPSSTRASPRPVSHSNATSHAIPEASGSVGIGKERGNEKSRKLNMPSREKLSNPHDDFDGAFRQGFEGGRRVSAVQVFLAVTQPFLAPLPALPAL